MLRRALRLLWPALALALVSAGASADAGTTVDLEPELRRFDLGQERQATVLLNITNRGPVPQQYTLTVANGTLAGWHRSALPPAVDLAPGEIRNLTLEVSIDEDAAQGGMLYNVTTRSNTLAGDTDFVWIEVRHVRPTPPKSNASSDPGPELVPPTEEPPSEPAPPAGPPASDAAPADGPVSLPGAEGEPTEETSGPATSVAQVSLTWPDLGRGRAYILSPLLLVPLAFESARFRLRICLALFSRLLGHRVLEHGVRARIHQVILQEPGVPYAELRRRLRLGNGSLTHHLHVLTREHVVRTRREGVRLRFYPADRPDEGLPLLSATARAVLACVGRHPGRSPRGLAHELGISKQVAHYHVQRLERLGLLRKERAGRGTRCFALGQRAVPISA